MKGKHTRQPGAPVFTARDYAPAQFSMPTDGRKGQQLCRDRRNLYVQICSYGNCPMVAISTLAEAMGWSERTVYRRLDELKTLGCVIDATDDRGLKYHGEHGNRVRGINTDMLPGPGSSRWLVVKNCPTSGGGHLLVRFVNVAGLSDSGIQPEAGLPDSNTGLPDSNAGLSDSGAGLTPCVADERTLKELPERTTPTTKEESGSGSGSDLEEQGMDEDCTPTPEEAAEADRQYDQHIVKELLMCVEDHPLPEGIRTGITVPGINELRNIVLTWAKKENGHTASVVLVHAWNVFLQERDFDGFPKKWTAWKAFEKDFETTWLSKGWKAAH